MIAKEEYSRSRKNVEFMPGADGSVRPFVTYPGTGLFDMENRTG